MKRYIISQVDDGSYNAGSKARNDVEKIALRMGYDRLEFSGILTGNGKTKKWFSMIADSLKNWNFVSKQVEPECIVLIQYPLFPLKSSFYIKHMIPKLQKSKNIKFIALIHDMDSLRGLNGQIGIYNDKEILPLFDIVICHNESMKKYLIHNIGIDEKNIVVLKIFDYLASECKYNHKKTDGLTIAGNLSVEKSGYIKQLVHSFNNARYPVHLYGNGGEVYKQATFHGTFSSDLLPEIIEGGFGLVWDGDSVDSCTGGMGGYLQYNNPHKLSLYLASGMPCIIWEKAAMSSFVKKYGVGICVKDIRDIPEVLNSIDDDKYVTIISHVMKLTNKIRTGYYTTHALNDAECKAKESIK